MNELVKHTSLIIDKKSIVEILGFSLKIESASLCCCSLFVMFCMLTHIVTKMVFKVEEIIKNSLKKGMELTGFVRHLSRLVVNR
jgi:hypothetical protein